MIQTEFSAFSARVRAFIESFTTEFSVVSGDHEFNALALDLFRLQARGNPAVERWLAGAGRDANQPSCWTEIPALPTVAFKEWDVTAIPAPERVRGFLSSGTTLSQSSRHYHCAESLALYEISAWNWAAKHLLGGEKMAGGTDILALTPPGELVPHSSLVHMLEIIIRRGRPGRHHFAAALAPDGSWQLAVEQALEFLMTSVRAGRPALVLSTAFMLVPLLDALEQRGTRLHLPTGSSVMETGGYKGRSRLLAPADLHRLITQYLGVPAARIVGEYGMAELSSQAYDCGAEPGRVFHFPPWARARVISPETGAEVAEGETGLIQICDLANVYSYLAVRTEDLGTRCGGGFALRGRAPQASARGCSLLAV